MATRGFPARFESRGIPRGLEIGDCSAFDSLWRRLGMPTAYSADLRRRVIEEVETGASRREAAEHFAIDPSSAVRWLQCWSETGRCAPKPRGGSISPLEQFAEEVLALVAKQPDLTLEELVAALLKLRIRTSKSALSRFFQRHEITFKKKESPGSRTTASRRSPRAPALDSRARPARSCPIGVH
jgi:transposase